MMTIREAYLKELAESPDDKWLRLAYAEWLDENGEPEEAERQRDWSTVRTMADAD